MGYLALGLRFGLASVLLIAGLSKIGDPARFSKVIAEYELAPMRVVPILASWLPRLEIAVGGLLALGIAQSAAALVAAGMLVTFSFAVAVNLLRGRRIGCGCLGASGRRAISWWTVTRNVVLVGTAGFVWIWSPTALTITGSGRDSISTSDGIAVMVLSTLTVGTVLLIAEARRLRSTAFGVRGGGSKES